MRSVSRAALAATGLILTFSGAHAQTPPGLGDLVGVRGASGENALQSRGYAVVRGEKSDDRSYTYWWNARSRQCVTVATMDGRYASITASPAPDCGKRSDGEGDRRDRGPAYHPDLGYRPAAPREGTPSYAPSAGYRAEPYQGSDGGYAGGPQGSLGLVCFGSGQRPMAANSYGYTWDDRRDRYVYGDHTELTDEQFDASVMIQVSPGGGRIRLPGKLIPPIHSRGPEGWWELSDVSITPDVISARYRLNGLNKPQVTIDRRSGRIRIAGTADYAFRGECDLVGQSERRRF